MTTPRNDEIQAAIVAYLKGIPSIYNELRTPDFPTGTASEIREDQWQGTEFEYPNIRVRMISNNPFNEQCCQTSFAVSIMSFSQDYSSKEADRIAGVIHSYLSGKSFEQNNVGMHLRTVNLIPAIRSDIHTWRAECLMQGTACSMPTGTSAPSEWWLQGEVLAGDCVAAYAAKGAASYAASKISLVNPSASNLLLDGVAYPTWANGTGWTFDGTLSQYLLTPLINFDQECSIIIKYSNLNMLSHVNPVFRIFRVGGEFASEIVLTPDDGKGSFYYYYAFSNVNDYHWATLPSTQGIMGVCKNFYYDCGVQVNWAVGISTTFTNMYIGTNNGGGYLNSNISSFALYKNTPLTFAQFDAIAGVMP